MKPKTVAIEVEAVAVTDREGDTLRERQVFLTGRVAALETELGRIEADVIATGDAVHAARADLGNGTGTAAALADAVAARTRAETTTSQVRDVLETTRAELAACETAIRSHERQREVERQQVIAAPKIALADQLVTEAADALAGCLSALRERASVAREIARECPAVAQAPMLSDGFVVAKASEVLGSPLGGHGAWIDNLAGARIVAFRRFVESFGQLADFGLVAWREPTRPTK